MKRFSDYFETFVLCIREKEGCPKFSTYRFSFEYQGKQEDGEKLLDIEEAESIFNDLLDNGHSWINIVCNKVLDDCLFVIFEVSKTFHRELKNRTKINLGGPLINIRGEYMWAGRKS